MWKRAVLVATPAQTAARVRFQDAVPLRNGDAKLQLSVVKDLGFVT